MIQSTMTSAKFVALPSPRLRGEGGEPTGRREAPPDDRLREPGEGQFLALRRPPSPRTRGEGKKVRQLRCVEVLPPPPASAFSRMPESVAVGVIASGSIFRWMMAGLPEARAAAKAAGKSAVFSTRTPKPPKAFA